MKKNALALAAALLAATPLAHAKEPWDALLTLQVGGFRADASTSVRLDSDSGRLGTSVSLEGDMGVTRTKTLPQIDFLWRINPRHGIEASYVNLKRDGDRSITGSIDFGEITFPINTSVNTHFKSDVYRVAYRYSPINEGGNELSLLLGAHYTRLEISMTGQAGTLARDASVDFPLPTIGARGGWRFADKWRATGFVQFLKLKINDYDGSLVNAGAGVEWAVLPQAYVGVGYSYYKYQLDSSKEHVRGKFDYRFDGPGLYAAWTFN